VFGERVARRLVLADVQRVGERADLVERAAQEQLVTRHAGEVERGRRHEEHLVARGREVELLLAAVLQVGDDRFAGAAEIDHRVADLLDLPPQRRRARGLQDDARDALVGFGLAQHLHDAADRRGGLEQRPEHAAGIRLVQIAADAEHQRRVRGNLRLAPHGAEQQQHPGGRNEHG
jgi:hypothetical protein